MPPICLLLSPSHRPRIREPLFCFTNSPFRRINGSSKLIISIVPEVYTAPILSCCQNFRYYKYSRWCQIRKDRSFGWEEWSIKLSNKGGIFSCIICWDDVCLIEADRIWKWVCNWRMICRWWRESWSSCSDLVESFIVAWCCEVLDVGVRERLRPAEGTRTRWCCDCCAVWEGTVCSEIDPKRSVCAGVGYNEGSKFECWIRGGWLNFLEGKLVLGRSWPEN